MTGMGFTATTARPPAAPSVDLSAAGLEVISANISSYAGRLWMLDYDGCLTEIVSRPEDARITPARAQNLLQLSQTRHEHVSLVSGRSVEQLLGFLSDIPRAPIVLVGLHGGEAFDMRTGEFVVRPDPSFEPIIREQTRVWEERVMGRRALAGVQLENKRHTLAVHFRNAVEYEPAQRIIAELFQTDILDGNLPVEFGVKTGKSVMELAPKKFQKGNAVGLLFGIFSGELEAGFHPVSTGDDHTDEDAFKVVKARGGTTIYVGSSATRPESAGYRIQSPDELYQLMNDVQRRARNGNGTQQK